jgi:glycosylphosphatidylinositol phospholipase D
MGCADACIAGVQIGERLGDQVARAGNALGDGPPAFVAARFFGTDSYIYGVSLFPGDLEGDVFGAAASASVVLEDEADWVLNLSRWPGDADGDGVDDLLLGVGAPHDSDNGVAYLLSGPFSGTRSVAEAAVRLEGEGAYGEATAALGFLGDVDGDGLDDVTVSDPSYDDGDYHGAGAVYLFYGPVTASGSLSLSDVRIVGGGRHQRASGAGVGDTNGDGYADLMVSTDNGNMHLFRGPIGASATPATAEGHLHLELDRQVTTAGDLDGDGGDDLLVGIPDACSDCGFEFRPAGDHAGEVYLFSGRQLEGCTPLGDAMARIRSTEAERRFGIAVSAAGDMDGDGLGDLLVGALPRDSSPHGEAWLYLGPLSGDLDMALDADIHFASGESKRLAGSVVAGLDDLDGDGLADIAIAAPEARGGVARAGAIYLVHGHEEFAAHFLTRAE